MAAEKNDFIEELMSMANDFQADETPKYKQIHFLAGGDQLPIDKVKVKVNINPDEALELATDLVTKALDIERLKVPRDLSDELYIKITMHLEGEKSLKFLEITAPAFYFLNDEFKRQFSAGIAIKILETLG